MLNRAPGLSLLLENLEKREGKSFSSQGILKCYQKVWNFGESGKIRSKHNKIHLHDVSKNISF